MATLQARILLLAFVSMAIAITYNATYLQTGMHPAPMANKMSPPAGSTASRGGRSVSKIAPPPKSQGETAPDQYSKVIQALQEKLGEMGYQPGPADGVKGPMTTAAIMAYQGDNSMPMTGIGDEKLLKNMILGISLADGDKDEKADVPEDTRKLIARIQTTLAKLGHEPGPVDGVWGGGTRRAIESFEKAEKAKVKGRISGLLVQQLIKANGGKLELGESG